MGPGAYAASKASVMGMTLPIARDLMAEGISGNTILPGIFDTLLLQATPPNVRDALAVSVPFPKRLGQPAEYAALVGSMLTNGYLNAAAVRLTVRFAWRRAEPFYRTRRHRMHEAFIVAAVRTARGRKGGCLGGWPPADLAAQVIDALVARSGIDPAAVEDVIMGCVSQVGKQSVNAARNAVLASRLPESLPATSVDRQCGSSRQALHSRRSPWRWAR